MSFISVMEKWEAACSQLSCKLFCNERKLFENSAVPEAALDNIKIKSIIFLIAFLTWIYNQTPNTCVLDLEV